jgi:hypothetical protein
LEQDAARTHADESRIARLSEFYTTSAVPAAAGMMLAK